MVFEFQRQSRELFVDNRSHHYLAPLGATYLMPIGRPKGARVVVRSVIYK